MTDKVNPTHTNRLIHEKSPYLLQHAHNPVNWFPWSEETFQLARQEDKPIFLSIGYSTCHWCHVMERESFEDEEVADVLNEHYVCIKVDREERPDVDHIYMGVCQALTGHGGWPLSIFMTPDQKPFYAGTYFPKQSKMGHIGLLEILEQIQHVWKDERAKIESTSEKITSAIQKQRRETPQEEVTNTLLDEALQQYSSTFDPTYGGFGPEPKFPTPHNYMFLLREWKRTGNPKALHMVEQSLTSMHRGGIYDHVGFGFSRYSVDNKWLVPHFEKMLYDNALLAYTFIEAYLETKNPYYKRVSKEIFDYVERVMTAEEGGFYSAEDADSEGVEGKFYVWNPLEIKEVLGEALGSLYCEVYDITNEGNFEGANIPNLIQYPLEAVASRHGKSIEELESQLEEARQKLFAYREERVHPHKDDKILTSWNALMIAALAKGAVAFNEPHYLALAQKAAHCIETHLVNPEGRILARYRDGEANFLGYIDDYAFYIWALHELYFASGDPKYLQRSTQLIDEAVSLFWDEQDGGFFFNGSDSESLITRPKEIYDGAIPSGNSVMAYNLVRHLRLTGEPRLEELLTKQVQAFYSTVRQYPSGFSFFLLALQMLLGETQEMVIVEGNQSEEFRRMIQSVQQTFLPFSVLIQKGRETSKEINRLASIHQDKEAVEEQSTFYLCQNFACQQPLVDVEKVEEALSSL